MRVGIVGDIHAPFTHPMYLRFVQDTFRAFRVDHVHFAGDIVDNHAISNWEHDPNGMSAEDEHLSAKHVVKRWHKTFNASTVSIGNHDERHFRLAKKCGMPDRYLRSYVNVWNTPGWDWQFEHTLDGVLYTHGTGTSGKDAAYNLAIQRRLSVVMGHVHGFPGVKYHANARSIVFGLNVGCGIDNNSFAFAYGRAFPARPVLGCGIVCDGFYAVFHPMRCGRGDKYHRSRAGKRRKRAA